MMFYAYMLRCNDGGYYVGHTDDLDRRVAEHQSGLFKGHTEIRRPVRLIWSDTFPTRIEALEAERRIKGWTRAKKQALAEGDLEKVAVLARNWQV